MTKNTLIHNATIVNEGRTFEGSVHIVNERIAGVFTGCVPAEVLNESELIDAKGKLLLPGAIDDHVHFRDPGLTHKADLNTESRAALAGGVTSFMEMPNTKPLTVTRQAWSEKMQLAAERSLANYSFYLGATNDNLDELASADFTSVCGVKVFMGSSTGNMLVGQQEALERIFKSIPSIVSVHAESEAIIQSNKAFYTKETAGELPLKYHSLIRSEEACYASTSFAVELAERFGTRLHVLHLSTARELSLFSSKPLSDKKITAEVCIPHLWFDDSDYERCGNRIKCNPAIKTQRDKDALRKALKDGVVDVVATDHAPHLWEEKQGNCITAASGCPGIQFSLVAMLELAKQGIFKRELVVEKMCHAPAKLYRIEKRGFVRDGYYADLVLVNPEASYEVQRSGILSKCGWSPFEGVRFSNSVEKTWVNGTLAYDKGIFAETGNAKSLRFAF